MWKSSILIIENILINGNTRVYAFKECRVQLLECGYNWNKLLHKMLHTLTEDEVLITKFDKIAVCHLIKKIEACLCFCIFGENSKMVAIFGNNNGQKILTKSLHLRWLRRQKHFCIHFEREIFENWAEYITQIPVGRKFRQNHYLERLRRSIFGENCRIQYDCHFWREAIFLQDLCHRLNPPSIYAR